MGSKALLMINGAPPRAVQAGATIDGIKLLSVQSDQVVVDVDVGARHTPTIHLTGAWRTS